MISPQRELLPNSFSAIVRRTATCPTPAVGNWLTGDVDVATGGIEATGFVEEATGVDNCDELTLALEY